MQTFFFSFLLELTNITFLGEKVEYFFLDPPDPLVVLYIGCGKIPEGSNGPKTVSFAIVGSFDVGKHPCNDVSNLNFEISTKTRSKRSDGMH